jgi:hypothetical protein
MVEEEARCSLINREITTALSDGFKSSGDDITASTIRALGENKVMFWSLTRDNILFYLEHILVASVEMDNGSHLAIDIDSIGTSAVLAPVVLLAFAKGDEELFGLVILSILLVVMFVVMFVALITSVTAST